MLRRIVQRCSYFSANRHVKTMLSTLSRMASSKLSQTLKTISDFGYGFNEEGQLRKLDAKTGLPGSEPFEFSISSDHATNQKNYEDLGEAITEYVYDVLEKELNLEKLPISDNPSNEKSFIYATKGALQNKDKLLILIHGSGVVRAGQWARSLIINDSLRTGTQFEYIRKAIDSGYGVIVTNTNDNYRSSGNKKIPIPSSSSPEVHMDSVWNTYLQGAKAKYIFIVAHSYGGEVTQHFVNRQYDNIHDKLIAVAFTDSVHSMLTIKEAKIADYLREITRNWVTSHLTLDTPEKTSSNDIPRLSAGHTKHEMTSSCCINSVFAYFDEQYASKSLDQK